MFKAPTVCVIIVPSDFLALSSNSSLVSSNHKAHSLLTRNASLGAIRGAPNVVVRVNIFPRTILPIFRKLFELAVGVSTLLPITRLKDPVVLFLPLLIPMNTFEEPLVFPAPA